MGTNEVIQNVMAQTESLGGGFISNFISTIIGFYQTYIKDPLISSLKDYGEIFWGLLIIVIIVAISWIIAKIVQLVIRTFLRIIHFDNFADKSGFSKFLEHGGLHNIPSTTISNLIYWILLFIGFTVAINYSTEVSAPTIVKRLFNYIPEALLALLICMLGLSIAVFLSKILQSALTRAGLREKVVSFLQVFIFLIFAVKSLLIGLSVLKVDEHVINAIINNVLQYSFVAFAIAFGLGARHLASDIIASLKLRKLYSKGIEVNYDDVTGVLKEVGWFDSLVYTDKGIINIPNSSLARKIIKRKI